MWPAVHWACLAPAADEVQELVESGSVCALVHDRADTLRREGILKRYDSYQNGLAWFARSNLCLVHVTPKTEDSSKIPDLDIVLGLADKSIKDFLKLNRHAV
jgi:hypothetical protein